MKPGPKVEITSGCLPWRHEWRIKEVGLYRPLVDIRHRHPEEERTMVRVECALCGEQSSHVLPGRQSRKRLESLSQVKK